MAGTSRADTQIFDATTSRGVPPTNYDVFLNHRGPDVKKGFVDHLATALESAGVHTFVDHKDLERGEDTWPDIESAIRHSKLHVAIFSPGYVSSEWCLKELCEILECRTSESFLPIFFNVQPSELRYLSTPSCREVFAKHDTRNDKEEVNKWKKALKNASMVTGWTLEGVGGFEARLVKLIVSKILDVLNPKSLDVAKYPVGMDEKLQEALDGMKIASEKTSRGLHKFGILGMGGVGKTTLVKSIFNEIYRGFDGSCFIESVRLEAQSPKGLRGVQEHILSDLLKRSDFYISSISNGKQVMRDRCSGLKILLILDDIDDRDQLDALISPFESCRLDDGSHAVITTRDEQVVKWAKAQGQLSLEGLSEAHAHQLFNWHAFLRPEAPKELEPLAKRVVTACHGHPLALETLGAHLYDKGMGIWEATVKALQSNRGNLSRAQREVMKVLQISYDGLGNEEQEIFLDVACFTVKLCNDEFRRVWSASSDTAEISLETLRLKSLVKMDGYGRLTMHDLLRLMGCEIVVASHKNVWERRYLWDPTDIRSVLQGGKGASELRALYMSGVNEWPWEVNAESFAGMDSLRFLVIENEVKIIGDFRLSSKELRWLKWHKCPLQRLPREIDLSKVAVLELRESNIESLSNGHKFENLRELKLLSCCNFSGPGLPDFRESCQRLEKLHLMCCNNLESVPESIGFLSATLTRLNLSNCEKLTVLPDAIGQLARLETLELASLKSLEGLPQSLGNLTELSFLSLEGCKHVEELPFTIGNLRKLSWLNLSGSGIKEIPAAIGSLTNLVELDAGHCTSLVSLSEEIGSLPKLESLDLHSCWNLKEVPPLPSSLEKLDTEDCRRLREVHLLPDSSLKIWSTRDCSRLTRLPYGPSLECLDAAGCSSLGTPAGCSQLAALTSIRHLLLQGTGVSLGPWIQNLASLETVALDGESLPEFADHHKPELNVKAVEEPGRYSVEMTLPHTLDGMECKALVLCCTSLYTHITLAIEELRMELPNIYFGSGSLQLRIIRATQHRFVASLKGATTHSFQITDLERHLHTSEQAVPVVAPRLVYEDCEFKEVLKELAGTSRVKRIKQGEE